MNRKELKVLSEWIERKLSEDHGFVILNNQLIYDFVKENSVRHKDKNKLINLLVRNIATHQKKIINEVEYNFTLLINKHPSYKNYLKFIESHFIKDASNIPALNDSDANIKVKNLITKIDSIAHVLESSPSDAHIHNIYEQDSSKEAAGHFILCLLTGNDPRFSYKDKRFYFQYSNEFLCTKNKTTISLENIEYPLRNVFKKINKSVNFIDFKDLIIEHSTYVLEDEIKNLVKESDKKLSKLASDIGIHDFSLLLKNNITLSAYDTDINSAIDSLRIQLSDRENIVKAGFLEALGEFGLTQSKLKDFYPSRNKMKITLYCGETNSGKTYQSFKHMASADSGLYMAPLRLLAMEGKEHIENLGHECNLITGDYQELYDSARFTASTVEMIDSSQEYDVAILDEVQLIFNEDRGWAWTQALLSVKTKHLVLTGTVEIKKHIEVIARYLNADLEVIELKRKTILERVQDEIFDFDDIPDHSAIIAFTKRDVIKLKDEYEKTTGKKASVIFGALTPKLRKLESDKFRSGETKIVIATDAISMGLNLPIKGVYFSSLEKFDGRSTGFIEKDLAIQIIGRAGRYLMFDKGLYGVFNCEPMTLDAILDKPSIERRSVFPYKVPFKMLDSLSNALNTTNIHRLLNIFVSYIELNDELFDKMDAKEQLSKALLIEQIDTDGKLTLKDKYKLINAPISLTESNEFIFTESLERLVNNIDFDLIELPDGKVKINNIRSLDTIEVNLSAIDFYLWLSFAFSENFGAHSDRMINVKDILNKKLTKFLSNKKTGLFNCLNECGAKISLMNKYCDKCKDNFNV